MKGDPKGLKVGDGEMTEMSDSREECAMGLKDHDAERKRAELEQHSPRETVGTESEPVAIWQITHRRRQEADRLSQREQAFWTLQRLEIQRRLDEAPPSVTGDGFSARGFGSSRAGVYRYFGPALTGSAVAATLMVVAFSSLGPWSAPTNLDPAPKPRSTAELRGLFAEIGQSLARHEPGALVPALPVQQALDAAWAAKDSRQDSPWNTTVKLNSRKEL